MTLPHARLRFPSMPAGSKSVPSQNHHTRLVSSPSCRSRCRFLVALRGATDKQVGEVLQKLVSCCGCALRTRQSGITTASRRTYRETPCAEDRFCRASDGILKASAHDEIQRQRQRQTESENTWSSPASVGSKPPAGKMDSSRRRAQKPRSASHSKGLLQSLGCPSPAERPDLSCRLRGGALFGLCFKNTTNNRDTKMQTDKNKSTGRQ